jgi:hypothetical protein
MKEKLRGVGAADAGLCTVGRGGAMSHAASGSGNGEPHCMCHERTTRLCPNGGMGARI